MARTRIGISGWRYAGWRGDFYPTGLVQRRELEYAGRRLTSIEINGSFYSLQRPTSYAAWREQTPDDFVFSVKGGRFITHLKRLADVGTPPANFLADTAGKWPKVDEDTADFRYVRLHGDAELYASGYNDASLDEWAEKCRRWAESRDVYVYFDNDIKGYAPHDAMALQRRLGIRAQ